MLAQSLKTFHWKKNRPGDPVLNCKGQEFACKSKPERICIAKSESNPKFSKDEGNLDPVFQFESLGGKKIKS